MLCIQNVSKPKILAERQQFYGQISSSSWIVQRNLIFFIYPCRFKLNKPDIFESQENKLLSFSDFRQLVSEPIHTCDNMLDLIILINHTLSSDHYSVLSNMYISKSAPVSCELRKLKHWI